MEENVLPTTTIKFGLHTKFILYRCLYRFLGSVLRLLPLLPRIYALKKTINTTGEPLRVFKMAEMAHVG